MKNKLIVRIAEGLGNQLFMYAHAFALSKKINFDLLVDNESAYFKDKDIRKYLLNEFNISSPICSDKYKYTSYPKDLIRKLFINIDKIKSKKSFLIETKNKNKLTNYYNNVNNINLNKNLFVEGYFETEKYFKDFRSLLVNELKLINSNLLKNNIFYNEIQLDNVVSICVRQKRFSERVSNTDNIESINKSEQFTKDTIDYIKKAEKFIETKILNPNYYIWSNDFHNLKEYFPHNKYKFVDNSNNKTISDFFLLTKCKNFIVGPTTFHWWGAWLSESNNKICIRPKNLNPSNNIDFWPDDWISI
jgi:hypothetical protein